MPIYPLPQFEADLAEQDKELYAKMKPPTTVVVRFGVLKMVGEFTYHETVKPGCGTKFVVRSHRGTELGEMLTSTCPNSGCNKSVTRKEMLEYIENSGGKDYPYFGQGKVLRIATPEDLAKQAALDAQRVQMTKQARAIAERMNLPMKVVDAEQILGAERITFYFVSEDRVDFRELVEELAYIHNARIDLRHVGARDEARITADYEKCGQHCCCKQFLKVLKPVSMKNAKIQKATLDPLKISGRCGRLMCCLRYEESTYDDLRARLPKKKQRVSTPHGVGFVVDSQILTQLVLVQLEDVPEQVAVAVEELTLLAPGQAPPPMPKREDAGAAQGAAPGAPTGAPMGAPAGTAPGARPREGRRDGRDGRPGGARPDRPDRPDRRDGDRRGPRPDGARSDGPRPEGRGPQGPRPAAPTSPSSRPPSPANPPTGPGGALPPPTPPTDSGQKDELDEIMDALESSGGGGGDGPDVRNDGPGGPDAPRKRRRRRRRRGGGQGPGGDGAGPGPSESGGDPNAG
jgi:cell fate regulator YaaT (PSP1 superfamily)